MFIKQEPLRYDVSSPVLTLFGHLAVVIDIYSRRVIGWAVQSRQIMDDVLQALLMGVWRHKPKEKVLIHSDQGSQFTSMDWTSFLKHDNLVHSIGRRGNCHDNAVAGRVDVGSIAIAGHSFGAWAASMLLGARTRLDGLDRSDKRILAGVLLAAGGLGGDDLTELAIAQTPYLDTDFAGLDRPTLVVRADDDHSPLTTRGPDWFRDPYLYHAAEKPNPGQLEGKMIPV